VDLDRYRLSPNGAKPEESVTPNARVRLTGWFVKGPIPGVWIGAAAKLPGKALHVALALMHEVGMKKNQTVTLTHRSLKKFGITRQASSRALGHLAKAELVSVDQRPGRCPRVTVLQDVAEEDRRPTSTGA
jgi:hypothetical protein